ncbi:MAG TPA: sugar phosphate isomerase/epimerase [Bryobacteraceae bacterium]|nr:sugar phosphate isomerase/epimerase [Bryobacteraceae bacterium]
MSQTNRFRKPLGAELYTVRQILPHKADITIKRIEDIGYSEVECGRHDLAMLAPILKKYGMTVPSVHLETGLITGQRAEWKLPARLTWENALDEAKSHGAAFAVIPYVHPHERGNLDDWRALCEKLNKAGETARAAGLTLCYHNHAFELAGEPGKRPIDILIEHTDADLVGLEIDVFWLSVAGQDPAEFVEHHAARVRLIHLKDKVKSMPVLFDEAKAKASDFKEVGNGSLDFPSILRAADKAGVAHYFVEQDHTMHDPVDSLQVSYQHLRALTL